MKLCLFLHDTFPILDLCTSIRTTRNKRMRRQSDAVINTLHWDLEEEFSDTDTRQLQQ